MSFSVTNYLNNHFAQEDNIRIAKHGSIEKADIHDAKEHFAKQLTIIELAREKGLQYKELIGSGYWHLMKDVGAPYQKTINISGASGLYEDVPATDEFQKRYNQIFSKLKQADISYANLSRAHDLRGDDLYNEFAQYINSDPTARSISDKSPASKITLDTINNAPSNYNSASNLAHTNIDIDDRLSKNQKHFLTDIVQSLINVLNNPTAYNQQNISTKSRNNGTTLGFM